MNQELIIPETWGSLEEFAHWFQDNGYPMRVPAGMHMYVTDNSYSCVTFRQSIYQVELYLVAPNRPGHVHSHGFEYMSLYMGGHITGASQSRPKTRKLGVPIVQSDINIPHPDTGRIGEKTVAGTWHRIDTYKQGCIMYIIQKWDSEENMTSAILNYFGDPIGPIHADLLLKQ